MLGTVIDNAPYLLKTVDSGLAIEDDLLSKNLKQKNVYKGIILRDTIEALSG